MRFRFCYLDCPGSLGRGNVTWGESASNPLLNNRTKKLISNLRTKKQSTYNKNRWHIWEVWHLKSDEVGWEKNKRSESNSEKVSNVQSQAQGWWTLRSSLRGIISGVLCDFYRIYMTHLVSYIYYDLYILYLCCSVPNDDYLVMDNWIKIWYAKYIRQNILFLFTNDWEA